MAAASQRLRLPLAGLARAAACLAAPGGLAPARGEALRRVAAAMTAHPFMIGGQGRLCSEIARISGGAVLAKTGAEGVFVAALRDRGLGLALKVEDGALRAAGVALATLLGRPGGVGCRYRALRRGCGCRYPRRGGRCGSRGGPVVARLAGKVALITGAASGLGAAAARRFVEKGCRVTIADLDDAAGAALSSELGGNCAYVHADHTERAENEAAVAHTEAAFGGLDILYNNAGAPFAGSFDTVDDAALSRVMDANLVGPFRMTQAALPALRRRARLGPDGAAIVFTASLQAIMARPNFTPYTAAKHGIIGLMRGLSRSSSPPKTSASTPSAPRPPRRRCSRPFSAAWPLTSMRRRRGSERRSRSAACPSPWTPPTRRCSWPAPRPA